MSEAATSGADFKTQLRNGQPKIGLFLNAHSPTVAEQLAHSGYDWLLVDTQHGPMGYEKLSAMLSGIANGGPEKPDIAAVVKAKVTLIERAEMGGDCLNTGCVPSKTIIRTSRLFAEMRTAEHYGARCPGDIRVDFACVMQRMRRIRSRLSRVDEVFEKLS